MPRTYYLFSLLTCIFFSCNDKLKDTAYIPSAYSYPIDSLNPSRTFTYVKSGTIDENYIDFKLLNYPEKTLISKRQYTHAIIIDSTIIEKNDKLVEIFVFGIVDSSMAKGEIIQDTIINNNAKIGIRERLRVYRGKDFTYNMYSKEEYVTDTTISWQNKIVDCIKISAVSKNIISSTKDTSQKTEFLSFHNFYYGKNIGLLRYTTALDSTSYIFTLKDIKRN